MVMSLLSLRGQRAALSRCFLFLPSAQDYFVAGAGSSDADHSKATLKIAH
jgi:hypothetical protein